MARIKELTEAVAELRHCGESLVSISERLTELLGEKAVGQETEKEEASKSVEHGTAKDEAQKAEAEKEVRTVTKEEVRKLLSIRLKEGFREQIQELFRKYGGERLKDIDPSNYAGLLKDAEGLKDA